MIIPDISIVSLTWNSEKHIEPFLKSLINDASRSDIDIEIIVIDNGSTDSSISVLREYARKYCFVRFIPFSKNMGTTFSRNTAIKCASGEFILVLDSDTIVCEKTLETLINGYKSIERKPDTKISILHPLLIYPDGKFQESARKFPTLASKFYRVFNMEERRRRTESIESVLQRKITRVDYAISAAWFMRKDIFDQVGYLDERFFYAPEDAEFCARCWSMGYEVWYYPEAKIIHNCQRLTKKKPFSKLGLIHMKGLLRFWLRYHTKLSRIRVNYEG